MFRQTHPSVREFIDTLKLDVSHNRMLIAQRLGGAVYRDIKESIVMSILVSQHLSEGIIMEISYLFYVAFLII